MGISRNTLTIIRKIQIGFAWYVGQEGSPTIAEPFLAQLHDAAIGLHYLHERDLIHGDLKGVCPIVFDIVPCSQTIPQHNILITNDSPVRACLADFGLSTLTPNPLGEVTTITSGGTPPYMAPELLDPEKFEKSSSRPTKAADMYAFGMVIYEVLTGLDPFHDKKDVAMLSLIRHIVKGARPVKPSDAGQIGFGDGTWELVKECWKSNSTKRPTIEAALTHLARTSGSLMTLDLTSKVLRSSGYNPWEFQTSGMFITTRSTLQGSSRLERSTAIAPTHNSNDPQL